MIVKKLSKEVRDKVICFGCSWIGNVADLAQNGTCPTCKYESDTLFGRLLTLGEMLDSEEETGYLNIRLDLFLKALFRLLDLELDKETK